MKSIRTELKWAVIFILVSLLWMLLERLAGFHDQHIDKHAIVTNFFMIPAILIYYLAFREKKHKDLGGSMTFKQGMITGLIMTFFITLLTPLSQYLSTSVISPHYFENIIEYSVAQGEMDQATAEAYFNSSSYLVQSIIFAPVAGIMTSLIMSFFFRSGKKPAPGNV